MKYARITNGETYTFFKLEPCTTIRQRMYCTHGGWFGYYLDGIMYKSATGNESYATYTNIVYYDNYDEYIIAYKEAFGDGARIY